MTTLLDMTQNILAEMSGDEVNSIFDTEEAEQVARFIISSYNAMMSRDNWPHMRKGTQLTARSDVDYPTHLTLPSELKEVCFIKYDKRKTVSAKKEFGDVLYKEPDDFLRMINSRDSTSSTTQTVTNDDGITLLIRNDKAPEYYTSFNEVDIIFDSFDSDIDTTIQESKVQAVAYITPTLTLSDTSVLDLPSDMEPLLFEETLSKAQWRIKEFQDIKAEQEAVKQRRSLSRKGWKVSNPTRYPNYGRK